jgi:hypothetical protein
MRRTSPYGMLRGATSLRHMQGEGGCAVFRQGHLIAVVGVFLIGCAVLVVVGCAGVRSEAPKQGRTEATEGQGRSPEATSEEARCEGTRAIVLPDWGSVVTNDVPGCPKGGLLSGTDRPDKLYGGDGYEDEVRGLGGSDELWGGFGKDYMFGGPGDDFLVGGTTNHEDDHDKSKDVLWGGSGNDILYGGRGADFLYGEGQFDTDPQGQHEDVFYGGDGNDQFDAEDGQRDELYCGEGWDRYLADKFDHVSSSCEKKGLPAVP